MTLSVPFVALFVACLAMICTSIVLAVALRTGRKLRSECLDAVAFAQHTSVAEVETRLQEFGHQVAKLQAQVYELEEQARLASGAQAKSWSNISGRTQAIRMIRNGSSSDRVAAELSMTPGEVDLIRRVQQLTADSVEEGGGANYTRHSISPLRG